MAATMRLLIRHGVMNRMRRRQSLPLMRIAALVGLVAGGVVAVPAAATDRIVIVQPGDTLSEIALQYGVTVSQLLALNAIVNPSRIYPGERLRITGQPAAPEKPTAAKPKPVVHMVQPGENLAGIALRYGTTIRAIAKANRISNPAYLRVGQRLVIPGTSVPPANAGARMPSATAAKVASRSGIRAIIVAEAQAQGVPRAFALAVAWQESGWQASVVSWAGAVGVMQLTPATADWVGASMLGRHVNLYDARSNVRAGICLLRHYLIRYHGNRALVLAAYYQGQTAADRYGVYPMTRSYVASILALESIFAN
jgi:LysM repeat protein